MEIKLEKDLISKFTPETGIEIKREYEFIGGKVRFKTSLKNNSGYNITDVNINYIPEALKWIITAPKYEKKGDSVIISKIGKDDTKSVSLYLEPINCVESSINATISYFDIQNNPIAIPMKPKKISITCPIFFTEEEVNLARVKNLHNSLSHRDKKIFPIIKIDKLDSFFNVAISVLKTHDIKLIDQEFIEEEKTAEAWFYGITKVKKNRVITHIFLDGVRRIFLIKVSGDSEEQITSFLAEIGSAIREKLIDDNILSRKDNFWDIGTSVLSYVCPYCYSHISSEFVQKYLEGKSFKCKDCGVYIPKSEIKKVVDKIEKKPELKYRTDSDKLDEILNKIREIYLKVDDIKNDTEYIEIYTPLIEEIFESVGNINEYLKEHLATDFEKIKNALEDYHSGTISRKKLIELILKLVGKKFIKTISLIT